MNGIAGNRIRIKKQGLTETRPCFIRDLFYWREVHIRRLQFRIAQEVRLHLHPDPVQCGFHWIDAHQAGQQQRIDALDLDQRQHEGRFGQELLRAEVTDREGVYLP